MTAGEVTVTSASLGLPWCRVTSDEGGLGIAYTMDEPSRPAGVEQASFVGVRLRDVAVLAKSWNFAEAGIGMAAVNACYGQPERAEHDRFVRSAELRVADPNRDGARSQGAVDMIPDRHSAHSVSR